MTIDEARQYANFAIKEGYTDEDEVKDMTDEQLIDWAEYQSERGDSQEEENDD